MKRKPSTAPVVDSPLATSILPSTSNRPPTKTFRATTSAPDAPRPRRVPVWSTAPPVQDQSAFVSAPRLVAERQFGANTLGTSAWLAPPPQHGPSAEFAPPQPRPYSASPAPARRSLVGVLAAVAILVFVSERDRPANRAVVVPQSLLGLPRVTSPHLAAASAQVTVAMHFPTAPWGPVSAAYFGAGDEPAYFVTVAKVKTRLTLRDQATFLLSAGNGAGVTNMSTAAEIFAVQPPPDVAPGPYGGQVQCVAAKASNGGAATECFAMDDADVFAIVVFDSSTPQALLARQIIGAVERRSRTSGPA